MFDADDDAATIAAAIEESLAVVDYGAVLSARGLTLVALNDAGEIVAYRPDDAASD